MTPRVTLGEAGPMTILTIGHSNHDIGTFIRLVERAGVEVIVDVRSQPYSRHTPDFNRNPLAATLDGHGIAYRHEPGLGGRPEPDEMYDEAGHVLYGKVAASESFQVALRRTESLARTRTVAIMCGEEDPTHCHRRLLVGRVLEQQGWTVRHVRGDGSVQEETEIAENPLGQEGLFEGGEFSTWRSTRSVSPRNRPPNSSKP